MGSFSRDTCLHLLALSIGYWTQGTQHGTLPSSLRPIITPLSKTPASGCSVLLVNTDWPRMRTARGLQMAHPVHTCNPELLSAYGNHEKRAQSLVSEDNRPCPSNSVPRAPLSISCTCPTNKQIKE